MKKVFIFLLLFSFAATAYAYNNVQQAGFAYTPYSGYYEGTENPGAIDDQRAWSPSTSSNALVLLGIQVNSDTALQFLITDTSSIIIPETHIAASGTITIGNGSPIWKGSVGESLYFTTSTAGDISVLFWGYEE